MRLNAYLSRAGIASRRKADQLIKAGRVRVNGRPAQLNDNISEKDKVKVDARPVNAQKNRYILLYKPSGVVTTTDDPKGRSKVTDLVKTEEKILPVGRLDRDTTGILLLTNDGPLAYRLTHPKFKFDKTYEAKISGTVNPKILDLLSNGVELEDGRTAPAKAIRQANDTIELTIHEGRKRQVRRMIKATGLELLSLHRSGYGPLKLGRLRPGEWRELSPTELNQLKRL